MGTGTDRSNSLHKFTIPQELRWGNQRFLRCAKVNFDGGISTLRRGVTPSNSDQHRRSNCTLQPRAARVGKREREREMDEFLHGSHKLSRVSAPSTDFGRRFSGYDDGIAATREKVILDLRTAAEEMKDAIYNERLAKAPPPPAAAMSSLASELNRPWNLRIRRADLKTSANTIVSSTIVDAAATTELKEPMINAPKSNLGQSETKESAAAIDKPMRLRSSGATATGGKKKERPKFAVALTRREIEEDFYSMVGRRPPGKPKKRNRIVQRQLDTLFPGLWLSEVTANMYKVTDGEGR